MKWTLIGLLLGYLCSVSLSDAAFCGIIVLLAVEDE